MRLRVSDGVSELQLGSEDFSNFCQTAVEILDLNAKLKNYEAAKILFLVSRKLRGEQETVHAKIHEHGIFNETAFWEEIVSTLITETFIFPQRCRSLAGSSDLPLFEFLNFPLENFPASADAFGLAPDFTRDLISRLLDSHSELLGVERQRFEACLIPTPSAPLKVGKPLRQPAPAIIPPPPPK